MKEKPQSQRIPLEEAEPSEHPWAAQRKCPKCGGLLTGEFCLDMLSSELRCSPVRCIQCGNMFDEIMLKNRFVPAVKDSNQ